MKYLFTFLFMFSLTLTYSSEIVINEVSSINSSAWVDENYEAPDWIELKNISSKAINLNGYRISDKDNFSKAWVLPDTSLLPGELLVLSASDAATNSSGKYVVETDGIGIVPGNDEDGFTYYYMPVSGDFVAEFDFSSMRNVGTFGAAGITFKEELTEDSKYFGVYNLREDRTTYGLMRRTQIEKGTEVDYSYHHSVNPWGRVRLERKGNTIIGYDIENGFEWKEFARFEANFNNSGYIGLGFSSAKYDHVGKFTFSYLKINDEMINIEKLSKIDININKPSKMYISNEIHTNFKLSRSGETLTLWDVDGEIEHQLVVPAQNVDISYARDENGEMLLSYPATPGFENNNFYSGRCQLPTASPDGGFFESMVAVTLDKNDGDIIYYTLDGSEPTENSKKYTLPFAIERTAVLRAKTFSSHNLPSKTLTRTFFIGTEYSLPCISIATDSLNLWHKDTGLFIDKNIYWENDKPGHFEIWSPEGKLEMHSDGTMRLHGQKSRTFAQKSLRFHANAISDSTEYTHPFFGNESYESYEKILFRNGGTGWWSAILTDGFVATILKDIPSVIVGNYRAGVSYLNGKYYGIMNIREKVDEDLIAQKYGISAESINFVEDEFGAGNGVATDFFNDYTVIMNMDMTEENAFKFVSENFDLDNLYDYLSSQIFICNIDWPWKNVKYWSSSELDSKWRFIPHDMDYSFGCSAAFWEYDIFTLLEEDKMFPNFFTKLWENTRLKEEFINRLCDLMNSKFLEENTRPLLDKFAKQIEPYISLQQTTYSESAKDWHYSMDKMRAFAERRAYRLKEHMTAYFNCGDSALVNVSVNNNAAGYVRLNSLIINSFPWDGFYFQDVPITIEAVANPGSRFVRWSDPKYGTNPKISFKPSAVNNLVAIFDDDSESFDIVINEIMYKAAESEDTGDWIELYNPSPDSKDLSFWVLKDSSPDNVFTFPQGTVIEAESYLVITRKGKDFEKYHPDVDYIDELGFGLSEEDAVKLYNHTDELIDSVQYTAKNPWPSSSNGTGLSIELKNANLDNSLGQNWYASLIVRGTPGMKNSVDTVVPSSEKLQIEVFPNPTSSYLFIRTDYQEFEYKIVDALGSVKSVGKANYTVALSCLDLSIGSYFLEILVQGKAETIPFLIVR